MIHVTAKLALHPSTFIPTMARSSQKLRRTGPPRSVRRQPTSRRAACERNGYIESFNARLRDERIALRLTNADNPVCAIERGNLAGGI